MKKEHRVHSGSRPAKGPRGLKQLFRPADAGRKYFLRSYRIFYRIEAMRTAGAGKQP